MTWFENKDPFRYLGTGCRRPASRETGAVGKRVLVVDDHKDLRELITRRVEDAGYEVAASATNGPEALLVAEEAKPDIVVLDYMMPGMTGEEVARGLRGALQGVKIIACSGVAKSKPYWADAYVDKNQLVDLEYVLGSVLGVSGPRADPGDDEHDQTG